MPSYRYIVFNDIVRAVMARKLPRPESYGGSKIPVEPVLKPENEFLYVSLATLDPPRGPSYLRSMRSVDFLGMRRYLTTQHLEAAIRNVEDYGGVDGPYYPW